MNEHGGRYTIELDIQKGEQNKIFSGELGSKVGNNEGKSWQARIASYQLLSLPLSSSQSQPVSHSNDTVCWSTKALSQFSRTKIDMEESVNLLFFTRWTEGNANFLLFGIAFGKELDRFLPFKISELPCASNQGYILGLGTILS